MSKCTNTDVGNLLYEYELGSLNDSEADLLEAHLLECEHCRNLALENNQVAQLLREDNGIRELIQELAEDGTRTKTSDPGTAVSSVDKRPWSGWWRPVAVAAAVIAVLLLKPWNLRFQPTEEAEAADRLLAVMPFENLVDRSDSTRLASIAGHLLTTDLSESHFLRVVPNRTVLDLHDALAADETGSAGVASLSIRIAKAAQATWVLSGSIAQEEPNLVLTATLMNVSTGETILSHRVRATNETDIFSVIDELGARIRSGLLVPMGIEDEFNPAVADVSTKSPAAYRHYLEGIEYLDRLFADDARRSFEIALEYDSTFAMCYYYLAREFDVSSIARAVQFSARAGRRERQHILSLEARISGDMEKAVRLLQEVVETFPEDVLGWTTLAQIARLQGRNQDAIGLLHEAIRVSPAHTGAHNFMAYLYSELDDVEQALRTVDAYIGIAPGQPNPYDTKGDILAHDGRLAGALSNYRKAYTIKSDFADYASALKLGQLLKYQQENQLAEGLFRDAAADGGSHARSMARTSLALLPVYYGRLAEGRRILDDALAADRFDEAVPRGHGPGQRNYFASGLINLASGDSEQARDDFASTIEIAHTYNPADSVGYRALYAFALAQSGDVASAEEVIAKLKQRTEGSARDIGAYWIAEALLSFSKGEFHKAVTQLEQVSQDNAISRTFSYRFWRGRACLASGLYDDAIEYFREALGDFSDTYRPLMPLWDVQAHFYLGEAYERSGDFDEAIEQYEVFVSIWSDADPILQPMVSNARERLVKLAPRQ